MFLSMWDSCRGENEDFQQFRPPQSPVRPWTGYVQPYTDTPLDHEAVGQTVMLNMIAKAKRYIYITTPYLIIDVATNTALCTAAKSGISMGGTSVIIVVGVALETVRALESQMLMRHYKGFLK